MRRHHLIALGLVLLVAGVFSEVPRMDFLDWDDPGNVSDSWHHRPVTLAKVADLWRRPTLGFYIPVTRTVWAAIARVATEPGADPVATVQPFRPAFFHAANLVLHIASVLVVFAILRLLRLGDWAAAAGAALFGVHPVQVEPVAWVTGLKDVLAGLFALLALWEYLLYARAPDGKRRPGEAPGRHVLHARAPDEERAGRGRLHYALGVACFALAVLSKQTVVVLPAIAFALDVGVVRRPWRRSARALAAWLPVAAAGAVLASWTDEGLMATDVVAWWQRPFVAGDALAFYLGKLFLPIRLMAHYARAPALIMEHRWAYAMWLAPVALIVLLVVVRRRTPELVAAGAIFLAGVLPVLGVVPFYNQDVGTRFMYLSMLGAALALAWVVERWPTKPVGYAVILALATASGVSALQSLYWHNSVTLFERNVELNPRSWSAHDILGKINERRGALRQAEMHYRAAIEANPGHHGAHLNYGVLLQATGRPEQAVEEFRAALAIDGKLHMAHFNLGSTLLAMGRVDEAIAELRRAIDLSPGLWQARSNLGSALTDRGDLEAAVAQFRAAIRANPSYGAAHYNLGSTLVRLGRYDEARREFAQARRLGITVEPPPMPDHDDGSE